jgi:oligoribonuclease
LIDGTLTFSELNLIWIDLEMTGLDPERDRIIEIAVVVTDAQLGCRTPGPVFAIHQSDATLAGMDAWNQGTHGRSGLVDRVKASTVTEAEAETAVIEFLQRHVPKGRSPMCGNSICQDRRFLARTMPRLEAFLPLPQPRREHAEGAGAALEAGDPRRLSKGAGAHRIRRHRGIDRRARVLPRALSAALNSAEVVRLPSLVCRSRAPAFDCRPPSAASPYNPKLTYNGGSRCSSLPAAFAHPL